MRRQYGIIILTGHKSVPAYRMEYKLLIMLTSDFNSNVPFLELPFPVCLYFNVLCVRARVYFASSFSMSNEHSRQHTQFIHFILLKNEIQNCPRNPMKMETFLNYIQLRPFCLFFINRFRIFLTQFRTKTKKK